MQRIRQLIILASLFILVSYVNAQDKNEFKPSGKPVIKAFTEFRSLFSDGESSNAFRVTRAYVGYQYSFSKRFSAKVVNPSSIILSQGLKSSMYLSPSPVFFNAWCK